MPRPLGPAHTRPCPRCPLTRCLHVVLRNSPKWRPRPSCRCFWKASARSSRSRLGPHMRRANLQACRVNA